MRTSIGDVETMVTNDSSRMFSFKMPSLLLLPYQPIQAAVYAPQPFWLGSSGLILGTLIASLLKYMRQLLQSLSSRA